MFQVKAILSYWALNSFPNALLAVVTVNYGPGSSFLNFSILDLGANLIASEHPQLSKDDFKARIKGEAENCSNQSKFRVSASRPSCSDQINSLFNVNKHSCFENEKQSQGTT